MNLILLEEHEVDGERPIVLTGRRAHHVLDVLRARVGDELRVGVIRGPRGIGHLLRVDADAREIALEATWDDTEDPIPEVTLILALPRPKVLVRVLRTAACMGVHSIHVVNAWRVDKSYWHTPQLDPAALRDNLLLGAEQGATTWVPDIELHRLLMPFMRGPLVRALAGHQGPALILHPRAGSYLEDAARDSARSAILAIGPERGWIDREVESFEQRGFSAVRLGPAVLRVETAVSAVLAQLALLARLEESP